MKAILSRELLEMKISKWFREAQPLEKMSRAVKAYKMPLGYNNPLKDAFACFKAAPTTSSHVLLTSRER